MDNKDKALKIFIGAVALLAVAMVAFYWVQSRTRTTSHDVNLAGGGGDSPREEKSEFTGIYSSSDPVEGLERRLNFFSLNRKEDGSGFHATAKLDRVATTESAEEFITCQDAKVGEREFFVKCSSPEIGQISFVGEWVKGDSGLRVPGKVLWSKEGSVIADVATTLTFIPQ